MAEPEPKRARTDGDGPAGDVAPVLEPQEEAEKDAPPDGRPRLKGMVEFHTEDTTLNVMRSAFGDLLLALSEGGLQHLLAGARASVGLQAGRYMFEVRAVANTNPAWDGDAFRKVGRPSPQLRLGFAASGRALLLGESADSVYFDAEGMFTHNKVKTQASQGYGVGDVLTVVLNLDSASPNGNTVSLFKNGMRASRPQALPRSLQGKPLFPAITFKNLTVHYNFGPSPLVALPFKCRMVSDASLTDAVETAKAVPVKDGRWDVVFPVCLPDQGSLDWLDIFLEKNPKYTELSQRALARWIEESGFQNRWSRIVYNDEPEVGFGISSLEDGSLRRALGEVAAMQARHFVVMAVKANLLKDERGASLQRWPSSRFRTSARVMIGEPPVLFKKRAQQMLLARRQAASDVAFRAKQAEERKKKMVERQQKVFAREARRALRAQKKKEEAAEMERKLKQAKENGEEPPATEVVDDADSEEPDEPEEVEEDPPKVDLTADERAATFCKREAADLSDHHFAACFTKFSVPSKEEGFDEVKFEWLQRDKVGQYMQSWVQERKHETRVEDLQPSEWFHTRLREWQKAVHSWQSRQNQHKLDTAQKESNRQAKELSREADKMLRELAGQRAPNEDAAEGTQRDKSEPGGEGEGAGAKSGEPQDEDALDFDPLDVFGVEDVMDVGGGTPLFSNFAFEDWVMLSLRFELHLMAHSFARDTDDSDRPGMHIDHLAFYYSRYFQKVLSLGYYGASTVAQLLEMCRDTIEVRKNKVVASLVPDDLDSLGVFVMLTEESRRDRVLRIDCGDESARLKFAAPVPSAPPLPGAFAVVRPSLPAGAGSVQVGQLQMRPPPLPGGPGRPATGWPGAFQPPDPSMPPRPPPPAFQQPPMAGNFQPPPGAKLGAPPPPRPRPVWRSLRPARGP